MTSQENPTVDAAAAPAPVSAPAKTEQVEKAIETESKPESTSSKVPEDDLDDLDDLLDDFADEVLNKAPGSAVAAESASVAGGATNTEQLGSANIEKLIKDLKIEDPETKKQFEELVQQFESNSKLSEQAANPQNFEDVMKDTMERIKKSGKSIDEQIKTDQSATGAEDMLTQLLSGMGGAAGADGDLDMSKLLVDMLEQLSSKEVLYEPIKDLNTKFPEYLSENKAKLSDTEFSNYTKQYEITNDILAVFEAPGYDDNDGAKREHVNTLLESLQELGQPPSELVGDAGDLPGFGGAKGGAAGGFPGLDFNDKDLPKDLEKDLEEQCKQT